MLTSMKPVERPVFRFITWCTLYIFYFQVLSYSALSYASTSATAPVRPSSERSLADMVTEFFVSPAQAATDEIKETISAADTVVVPQGGESGGSDSVSLGGGSGSVNSVMGSYGYTYPIQVPPGRGGLAPQLVVSYSSMAGNGWLGLGWDISIGSIQRSVKDGKPSYNDDDTFVITLKGIAITLVREDNEFRLKDEGLFLRILKQDDSWVATDKGGTRYYFGTTAESRQYGPEGIFKWCLDYTRDPNGNVIVFTYDTDTSNNQIYLQRISYNVHNYILFESEPAERADAPPSYATFFKVRTVRRLQRIKVFNGGTAAANLVRRYELAYQETPITNQSMLNQITQYGSNGTALPPVRFEYTANQSFNNLPFAETASGTGASHTEALHMGDFTGDGRTDFVVTPAGNNPGNFWKLYKSEGDSFTYVTEGIGMGKYHNVYTGDFNGDGKADMLTYYRHVSQPGPLQLYLSTGDEFDHIDTGLNIYRGSYHGYDNNIYVGDFNGDGKSDFLTRFMVPGGQDEPDVQSAGWRLYVSTGDDFVLAQEVTTSGENTFGGISAGDKAMAHQHFIVGDFNGDGKSDAILQPQGSSVSWGLYLSTGKQLELVSHAQWRGAEHPFLLDRIIPGDFNGDGKTDLIVTADGKYTHWQGYQLFLSTGTEFVPTAHDSWPSYGERFIPGDYNGDGRTDLVVAGNGHQTTWGGYKIYLSTGSGFQLSAQAGSPSYGDRFYPGDFDGDGRADLVVTADGYYATWAGYKLYMSAIDQNSLVPLTMPNLVGGITNILGATTEITYTPSCVWPKDIDGDGSYRSMPMSLPTVSEVTTYEDRVHGGHVGTSTFAYEGGYYDIPNKEYRGFGKVTVEDQVTHIAAVNYYHQDPRFQGRIRKSITLTPGGRTVVSTVNDWDANVYYSAAGETSNRTFAFVRSNTTTSYDDAGNPLSRISTDYSYDEYGNVTVENKTEHNFQTGVDTTRFVRTRYINDSTNWILGQPENIRIDVDDPGLPGYPALRETRMFYNPARPWLLQHQQEVYWEDGTIKSVTTTYDYDAFGNPTWVSDPRNPSWGTLTDYGESNGMFPNRTTNALGHSIHRVFDPRFGQVTQETLNAQDGNQQKTTSSYDEFGRPDLITYPDSSTKEYLYNIEPGNHFIRVASTLMPTVTTYYDNVDRVVRQKANDGIRAVFTDTIYNDAGQVWKKSLPYYPGATPEYTVNTYEPLRGGIQRRTNPDGTYRTIEYDGFEEIITDEEGHQKTITKDSLGRLTKVVEPTGGVTEYEYDLFGNLIWIQGPMGNQTWISYDDLGRKISMDDPYMGHWEYKYDQAGNLVWQKDGRDRIVEMTYDEINRLETKTYQDTGRFIEYTYDEARPGFFNTGALTTLTATDPGSLFNTITCNYDLMGRNVSETRTIDGVAYTTRRQYDPAGRPDIITYPDGGTKIDYDYHPMGYLEKVYKLEADQTRTLLAQYSGFNALGQIGSLTYGNGATTSYEYWPGNHRLKWMQTTAQISPGSWGAIQDLEYAFDDLGNVETITDAVNGTGYDFTYDSVSRLTRATAAHGDPDREYDQAYTYDLAGNMGTKTGKGGFQVLKWQDE